VALVLLPGPWSHGCADGGAACRGHRGDGQSSE
jgi:hypothetical protein